PLFTNDLDHAAAQAEVAVGVFRMKDTERDGAPEAQDVGLGPSLRCVENDILTVQIHPHRRYVRCPVWQNDANVNEHLLLEYLALLRGQLPMRHRHIWMLQSHLPPLSCLTSNIQNQLLSILNCSQMLPAMLRIEPTGLS